METIKPQGINYDLSRGHKAYDTKVKNIIGIFQKLTGLEPEKENLQRTYYCFMFCLFGQNACGILASSPGIEP